MKSRLFLICFLIYGFVAFTQELSDEEKKLYKMIMDYRKAMQLPVIPLSKSLTQVAQIHVKDLADNKPDLGNHCNTHSWSDKGKWSACCYTPDHAQSNCMWGKPRELTSYKGDGFEIACGSNACCSTFVMTAHYALDSWKKKRGTQCSGHQSGRLEKF